MKFSKLNLLMIGFTLIASGTLPALSADPKEDLSELRLFSMTKLLLPGPDLDKEIERLSTMIKASPDDVELYACRYSYLMIANRFDEALADIDKIIKLQPKTVSGHLKRAECLARLNKAPEALAEYQLFLKSKPDDVQAYMGKAKLEVSMQRYDDALNTLNYAIDHLQWVREQDLYQMRGTLYGFMGKADLEKADKLRYEKDQAELEKQIAAHDKDRGRLGKNFNERLQALTENMKKFVKPDVLEFQAKHPEIELCDKFTLHDLSAAQPKDRFMVGFVNKKGDWVIPPQFSSAGFFVEGYAPISKRLDRLGGMFELDGFVDQHGHVTMLPHGYNQYKYAGECVYRVSNDGFRHDTFVGVDGKPKVEPAPEHLVDLANFAEGALNVGRSPHMRLQTDRLQSEFKSYESIDDARAEIARNTKLLQAVPGDAQLLFNRAKSYYAIQDYQNALNDVAQAMKTHQSDDQLWTLQTKCLVRLGQSKRAIELLSAQLAKAPTAGLWAARAAVYQMTRQYQLAMKDIDQALAPNANAFNRSELISQKQMLQIKLGQQPVKNPNEYLRHYRYVDKNGKTVADFPRCPYANVFGNGLAPVEDADTSLCGYIDRKGNWVIKPKYKSGNLFEDQRAAVQDDFNILFESYRYIDPSGQVIGPNSWDASYAYHDQLSLVRVGESVLAKEGFIDQSGKTVIPCRFWNVTSFSGGMAVLRAGGKQGFINRQGEIAIKPEYDFVCWFSDGLALVGRNKQYGFVDPKGTLVLPLQYSSASSFNEGLAFVARAVPSIYEGVLVPAGQMIIIDKTGKAVSSSTFDAAQGFSEGLAWVRKGNKWGVVDKTGKIVIPPRYDGAFNFKEGTAAVQINKRWGMIDATGKLLVPLEHDSVSQMYDGLALVDDRLFKQ